MSVTISRKVRSVPVLPYAQIKDSVLGKRYVLSLSFIGEKYARSLNHLHRNASYVPNVLSFPLTPTHGEIYITPSVARREARSFDMTPRGYTAYLFIHGLLHLKGYRHGATMEKAEKAFLAQFNLR